MAVVLIWGKNGAPNRPALIDQTGRIVFSGAGVLESSYFSEGLMPFSDTRTTGFVDKNLRWVIPPKYDIAEEFSNGLAPVRIGGKWGVIDKEGTEIVRPQFDAAWRFSDGLGRIRIDLATGKQSITLEGPRPLYRHQFGFVDRSGKEVIHPQFDWATDFRQNRAFVMLAGSRLISIIDKHGEIVHGPEYEGAGEFQDGLAAVCVSGKWGYVDTNGRWVITAQFTSGSSFEHGLARVTWADGYGYINQNGTVIWKEVTKQSSR
jgi:hypothetical protein